MGKRATALWIAAGAVAAACSAGCGGGAGGGGGGDDDGGDDGASAAVARIEVSPGSLLFGSGDGTAALTAVAYDADGAEVEATFQWFSSNPDQIAVDPAGSVQAVADVGSATIHAEADGVRSRSVLVASAELLPGTLLVTDAQVASVGQPVAVGPPEDLVGEVDVRLRGVDPPSVGQVVLAAEDAAVAGVVVAAEQAGDEVAVRLRTAPLGELFARYDLTWALPLGDYDITMDEEPDPPVLGASVGRPVGPSAGSRRASEVKIEKNFPPKGDSAFKCSAEATAYVSRNLVSVKLTGDAEFLFKSHKDDVTLPPGYMKIAIQGPLALTGTIGLKIEAGFEAKAKCELKGRIKLPILGWFSGIVSPALPLGVGVSLDGKLVLASLELQLEGRNGFDLGIGVECPGEGQPCRSLDKMDPISEVKPRITAPSVRNMRLELAASAYFVSGLDLVFLGGLYTPNIVAATFGPVQSAKLSFTDFQAEDAGYASTYDLKIEGKVGPGELIDKAIKELVDKNTGTLGNELTFSTPISRSPVGQVTVDRASVAPRRPVRFTVQLEGDSVTYFQLGYNVESVQFYRKRGELPEYDLMGTVAPTSSPQSRFEWEWTPTIEDVGDNEFFAFVKTSMPVIELEVAADSRKVVRVEPVCAPEPGTTLRAALGGGGCEVRGTLFHETVADTPVGSTTTTRRGSVALIEDPTASTDGFYAFRPQGTWSVEHRGTVAGCPLYTVPPIIGGNFTEDPTQGVLFLWTGVALNPEGLYSGAITTGIFDVTEILDCPDQPQTFDLQFDETVWFVLESQELFIGDDGRTIQGGYTEDQGTVVNTYTWDLLLQPIGGGAPGAR